MKKILTLVSIVLLFSCKTNLPTKTQKNSLNEALQKIVEKHELMGLGVAVLKDKKVVYEKYFGKANFEKNTPFDAQSKCRIASVSKTFTAIAIMQLYEQNLLSLDQDISQYVGFEVKNPRFPQKIITIRQLLAHTSSLRDSEKYGDFLGASRENKIGIDQILTPNGSHYTADVFADKEPATFFAYCNLNYGVLGTIVERVSKKRFDLYCKEFIFDKMGLACSFDVAQIPLKNLAPIYRKNDGKWTPQVDSFENQITGYDATGLEIGKNGAIFAPQGGLRASVSDLAATLQMFTNKGIYNNAQILKPQTIQLMQESVWENNGNNGEDLGGVAQAWGLGLHLIVHKANLDNIMDRPLFGHSGDAYGLLSGMFGDQDGKIGVIFMTNGSGKAFENGTKTKFYAIEEDIYGAADSFLSKK